MIRQAVLDAWHTFSEPLEGRVLSMYVDILNLVTTGVGNLIDPVGAALQLPWKHPDGRLASEAEIRAQWLVLKHHPGFAVKPGGPLVPLAKLHWKFAAKVTTLRLTDEDVDAIVLRKLHENAAHLERKHFPRFAEWPADAQLGVLSMAWAVGPGFPLKFTNFARAANAADWLGAQASCKIRETGNPGVVPRNQRNRQCFANAAAVVARGLPPDVLWWPTAVPGDAVAPGLVPVVEEPPTITDADRARAVAALDAHVRDVTSEIRADGLRELAGGNDADD